MLDLDDFQREYGEAIKAADKYVERSRKGIPSDRWAVGTVGAALVARGIEAHQILLTNQREALEAVWADIEAQRRRTDEGMGVFDKGAE